MAARILREQRHARRFAVATFAFTTSRSSLRTLILRSTRQFRPVNIPPSEHANASDCSICGRRLTPGYAQCPIPNLVDQWIKIHRTSIRSSGDT